MAEKLIKIRYEVETVDIEKADQVLKKVAASTDKADKEFKDLSKDSKKAGKDAYDSFKKASNDADKFGKSVTGTTKPLNALSGQVLKFGALLGGLAIASVFSNIGSKVFEVTSEFQKFEAVLTNTLGSNSAAQAALLQIQDFAANTPFSVAELTDSYVKLANFGLKPNVAQLRQLGDLAASTGKSFDMLTEAIIDASSGEFERLKEFGIRAQKEGDKVTFAFKGVKTQVDFTSDSITNYITGLGDLKGVTGSMAAISGTLGGQVSNLGDSFDQLFLAIGQAGGGVISTLIGGFNNLVQAITNIVKGSDKLRDEALKLKIEDIIDKKTPEQLREILKKAQDEFNKADQEYFERVQKRKKLEATTINDSKGLLRGAIKLEQEALKERDEYFEAIRRVSEKITQLQEEEAAAAEAATEQQIGLIEAQEKRVKDIQDRIKAATSEQQILSLKVELRGAEAELERLKNLGEAAKRLKENLEQLTSVDFFTGLTSYGEKLKSSLGDVYTKLYGEQVKGAGEATEANKKQSASFIQGVGEQINAIASKAEFENNQRLLNEQREKESFERRRELVQEFMGYSQNLLTSIADYQNQLDENRITKLEESKARELAIAGNNVKEQNKISLEHDKKIRDLRRKQAEREKRLAIFNAIVNVAQAVTAMLGTGPVGFVLAALAAAAGAVQIATISSQPIPAFNKGTKSVPGPNTNRDTVSAMLTPGEMVIPVATKKKYNPILNKIFDNKIDPELLNNIANGKSGGAQVIIKNDQKELVEFFKNRPEHKTVLTDEGLQHYYTKGNSRTKYLNSKYRSK